MWHRGVVGVLKKVTRSEQVCHRLLSVPMSGCMCVANTGAQTNTYVVTPCGESFKRQSVCLLDQKEHISCSCIATGQHGRVNVILQTGSVLKGDIRYIV